MDTFPISLDFSLQVDPPQGATALWMMGPVPPPSGFSGAPVLDVSSGQLIGLVQSKGSLDRSPGGRGASEGWAVVCVADVTRRTIKSLSESLGPYAARSSEVSAPGARDGDSDLRESG